MGVGSLVTVGSRATERTEEYYCSKRQKEAPPRQRCSIWFRRKSQHVPGDIPHSSSKCSGSRFCHALKAVRICVCTYNFHAIKIANCGFAEAASTWCGIRHCGTASWQHHHVRVQCRCARVTSCYTSGMISIVFDCVMKYVSGCTLLRGSRHLQHVKTSRFRCVSEGAWCGAFCIFWISRKGVLYIFDNLPPSGLCVQLRPVLHWTTSWQCGSFGRAICLRKLQENI